MNVERVATLQESADYALDPQASVVEFEHAAGALVIAEAQAMGEGICHYHQARSQCSNNLQIFMWHRIF